MWFYHWCGEINETRKKIRFGLTTFIFLFTQAVSRIYPHVPPLIKHLVLRSGINLRVNYHD